MGDDGVVQFEVHEDTVTREPLLTPILHVYEHCPQHPEDGRHQCMKGERRCVYCSVRLHPYPCHNCGKFMTAAEMHGRCEDSNRCEDCEP